ncbi:MAG: sensor histidine kinase, partial [Sedimenticolaceae bacterium]
PKLCVKGNRHLLAQLISNLLENAHKYAGDTARVELRLQRQSDEAVLTIADNGPGIPKDRMKDVLQRFVRLDTARSTAGNGLGLSLVQAVAEFHHAKLLLRNNSPGLAVSLSFPWQRCPPPQ